MPWWVFVLVSVPVVATLAGAVAVRVAFSVSAEDVGRRLHVHREEFSIGGRSDGLAGRWRWVLRARPGRG